MFNIPAKNANKADQLLVEFMQNSNQTIDHLLDSLEHKMDELELKLKNLSSKEINQKKHVQLKQDHENYLEKFTIINSKQTKFKELHAEYLASLKSQPKKGILKPAKEGNTVTKTEEIASSIQPSVKERLLTRVIKKANNELEQANEALDAASQKRKEYRQAALNIPKLEQKINDALIDFDIEVPFTVDLDMEAVEVAYGNKMKSTKDPEKSRLKEVGSLIKDYKEQLSILEKGQEINELHALSRKNKAEKMNTLAILEKELNLQRGKKPQDIEEHSFNPKVEIQEYSKQESPDEATKRNVKFKGLKP
jgi:hypothetical protein